MEREQEFERAAFQRRHQQHQSFAGPPSPLFDSFDEQAQSALADQPHAHQRIYHRPTRSAPNAKILLEREQPLPALAEMLKALKGSESKRDSGKREDISQGSWLDDETYYTEHRSSMEDADPFGEPVDQFL